MTKSTPTYNRRRQAKSALAKIGATEKRPQAGHNVSHALNRTKRVFKPNLQKTKILVDGKLVSVRLDARTLRTLTKATKDRPQRTVPATRQPTGKATVKPAKTAKPAAKPAAKKQTTPATKKSAPRTPTTKQ